MNILSVTPLTGGTTEIKAFENGQEPVSYIYSHTDVLLRRDGEIVAFMAIESLNDAIVWVIDNLA